MKLSRTGEETGKHAPVTSGYGAKNNIFIGASHNSTRILLLQQKQARPLLQAAVRRVMSRKVLARWLPENQPTHFYHGSLPSRTTSAEFYVARGCEERRTSARTEGAGVSIYACTSHLPKHSKSRLNRGPKWVQHKPSRPLGSVTQHKLNRP